LSSYVFATKACVDNRKKNLLNSDMSSTCSHNMTNFSRLTAEILSGVWATPKNSTVFACCLCYCSKIAHWRPTNHLLGWYTIYTFSDALAPDGILPGAKFTLRPSLAFSYIGSVTARHSSSGRQPNFAGGIRNGTTELSQTAPPIFGRAAIMLGIGPHSSFLMV